MIIGLPKRCRWCKHMVSVGDEGSMHCELNICKGDKTAASCSQFEYFLDNKRLATGCV